MTNRHDRRAMPAALLPGLVQGFQAFDTIALDWLPISPIDRADRAAQVLGAMAAEVDATFPSYLTQRWQHRYLRAVLDDLDLQMRRLVPVTVVLGASRFLQTCVLQGRGASVVFVDVRESVFLQVLGGRVHRAVRAPHEQGAFDRNASTWEASGLLAASALGGLLEASNGSDEPDQQAASVLAYLTTSMDDAAFSLWHLANVHPSARGTDRLPDWNPVVPALQLAHELAHVSIGSRLRDVSNSSACVRRSTLDLLESTAEIASDLAQRQLAAIEPADGIVSAAAAAVDGYAAGALYEGLEHELIADVHATATVARLLGNSVPAHEADGTGHRARWHAGLIGVALSHAAKMAGAAIAHGAHDRLGIAVATYLLRAASASMTLVVLDGSDPQDVYAQTYEYVQAGLICLLQLCAGLDHARRGEERMLLRRDALPGPWALPPPAASRREASVRFDRMMAQIMRQAGQPPLVDYLRGTPHESMLDGLVWKFDYYEKGGDEYDPAF
jgi:hypothetical protein